MGAIQHVPKDVRLGRRFYGNAGKHAAAVDVSDQLARVRLELGGGLGALGGGGEGGLVVETIQVAAGLFELLDPFLRLIEWYHSGQLTVSFSPSPIRSPQRTSRVRQPGPSLTSAIIMWQSKVPFP